MELDKAVAEFAALLKVPGLLTEVAARVASQAVDLAELKTSHADAARRLLALEKPPPVVPPVVPPVTPPVPAAQRKLLGGWRLAEPFARGGIAIDFDARRLYLAGHAQHRYINVYDLPPMGEGPDSAAWPALWRNATTIPTFWDGDRDGDAYGLCWWKGKLWVAPRVFYDTTPSPDLRLYATDGEVLTVPLPRQKFAGFVKRGPEAEPLIGGGCYQSGQGWASGNTAATIEGKVLLTWGNPAMPVTAADWGARQPRPANYSVKTDSWVGWNPRDGEGRWASDRCYGGGLVLPEAVTYWCRLGTGDLDYARQSETFGDDKLDRTYVFRFDKSTYKLLDWEETALDKVGGQELDAAGRVYLCELNAWQSGMYKADPVVRVYG